MGPPPVFVSYYTPAYADHANRLVASLRRFGLDHDVRPEPDRGSWQANTHRKPSFVRDMLDAHPGRDLVWLDADATVERPPALLTGLQGGGIRAPIACRVVDRNNTPAKFMTGTLFVRNDARGRAVVDAWIRRIERAPPAERTKRLFEQTQLMRALLDEFPPDTYERLPPEYTQKFDAPQRERAIIVHWQASRQFFTSPPR